MKPGVNWEATLEYADEQPFGIAPLWEQSVAVSGSLCSDSGDVLHAWCLAGLGI